MTYTTDYTDLHKTIFNLLITDNIYLCKSVQSVVNTSYTIIEPGSIWGGVPAKFIKKVDPEQAKELNQKIAKSVQSVVNTSFEHPLFCINYLYQSEYIR